MSGTRGCLTRDQVRSLDREAIERYCIPSLVLMENAGRACAELLARLGVAGRVLVVCGKGNNGGDGLVVARHLDSWGYEVLVAYCDEPEQFTAETACQFRMIQSAGIAVERWLPETAGGWDRYIRNIDWCVDAVLGTGTRGPPRSPYAELIRWMNQLPVRRLAVDLPSGLDADTGQAYDPTVVADVTCTFVAWKEGFANPEAAPYLGKIYTASIGVPRELLAAYGLGTAPRLCGV